MMTCERCGYAVGVRRVALLVDGRVRLERRLCGGCLAETSEPLATLALTVPRVLNREVTLRLPTRP